MFSLANMANFLQNLSLKLIDLNYIVSKSPLLGFVRYASKKSSTSTCNTTSGRRPKHRGWKRQDGCVVTQGTILATQYKLRFCPGLNVGAGNFGTLYAKVPGKVAITCEKTDFNPDHHWVKAWYPNRTKAIYKKYFNVIPEPQHQRFKLKDMI